MPIFLWRAVVAAIGVAAAMAASAAPHRVLHVCDCPASMASAERTELLTELAKLGYVQGRNIDLVSRDLSVRRESYEAYLRGEIAARRPELILASGILVAHGAQAATREVPVLFWRLTDPIGIGLVDSLAHPHGNLTGFSRAIEKLTPRASSCCTRCCRRRAASASSTSPTTRRTSARRPRSRRHRWRSASRSSTTGRR